MKVLVTGASENGGQAICHKLLEAGFKVRIADVMPPIGDLVKLAEFIRCDTRSPGDVRTAVKGVDRNDVALATVASVQAALDRKFNLFSTIIHTQHGMPIEIEGNFKQLGPEWCEQHVPGARELIIKYQIELPEVVEQHDLAEAGRLLGWKPRIGFLEFLRDLKARDERDEDVNNLWVPSELI